MEQPWGWFIAIYLFLGGLGAGAFLNAAAFELTGKRYEFDFCPVTLVGAVLSGPAVAIGTVLLIFDLGAGRMELGRILYLFQFRNSQSVMMWGVWVLSIFIPLGFLYGYQEIMDTYPGLTTWLQRQTWIGAGLLRRLHSKSLKRTVVVAGSLFALGTAVYTGVLLSAMGPAVPFWSTPVLPFLAIPMLPVLFLVSALSTGTGLTVDLAATISEPEMIHRVRSMPWIHLILIGVETLLLGLLLITAFVDGGSSARAARHIVVGPHSIVFWVLIVIPGFIFPFLVHVYAVGLGEHPPLLGVLSGVGIVSAGLFLRHLILVAGIPALM